MVVPVDTTVTLKIHSQDVDHSWWIPKLGGKFDAIPGYTNYTWFKIPAKYAGRVYTGQCAELCGRNHANMTAQVLALTPAQYERWIDQRKADIKAADDAAAAGAQAAPTAADPVAPSPWPRPHPKSPLPSRRSSPGASSPSGPAGRRG